MGNSVESRSVSSRARVWMSSAEKRSRSEGGEESIAGVNSYAQELDSNAPQVNKVATVSGEKCMSQKPDPPKKINPTSSSVDTMNSKRASDSWIRHKDTEKDEEQNPPTKAPDSWTQSRNDRENTSSKARENKSNVDGKQFLSGTKQILIKAPGSWTRSRNDREKFSSKSRENKSNMDGQRFRSEAKDTHIIEQEEVKSVLIPIDNVAENNVIFRSTAMGVRLKRGEDGFVRVVSVTEATVGSSVVRDGIIEPEDIVKEAAGVDLRSPITNSQWGETVTTIRKAARPMTFVIVGGPRRSKEEPAPKEEESSLPPSAKYVIESYPSKPPNEQQVLESLSSGSTYDRHSPEAPPSSAVHHANTRATQTRGAQSADASSADEEETSHPQKESLFKRLAGACASPNPSQPSSEHQDDESQVPMAHLQFLRTNPTIARVTNAASRRYPTFCGRPDTIFEEEPDDDERHAKASSIQEGSVLRRPYGLSSPRSAASSSYGSQTCDGSRTYRDDGSHTYDGSETAMQSTYNGSKVSAGWNNTAFLEKLAINSAVAMKPTPQRNESATNVAISQKLGNTASCGGHSSQHGSQGNNELGWPDNNEPDYEKDTIDNGSAYSSTMSRTSFQSRKKKNTVRHAELLASQKVEDMMNDLHYDQCETEDQCEI